MAVIKILIEDKGRNRIFTTQLPIEVQDVLLHGFVTRDEDAWGTCGHAELQRARVQPRDPTPPDRNLKRDQARRAALFTDRTPIREPL